MSQAMDRRGFLERAAASGTVASIALAATATSASAASEQRIVLGVMGLSRGSSLAVGFAQQPGVEVKYVCDVDAQRAASCVQKVKQVATSSPQAIGDFRRILDDKSVDALVCAAPNHWHAPATILACAAGKHVYVEKPCSHNPQEGERMVAAARKYNRAVQLGTQRRSSPGTIEAMQKLREGAIGRVYLARTWYNNLRPSIGRGKLAPVPSNLDYDLWQGPAPRRPYRDNVIHYNWHWQWHWGNGELGNNGVHTIDLCRWGLEVDYPVKVTSSGGRYRYDDDQQTPDTHTVCFEFEGRKSITWQGLSCNRHGAGFVTFYGQEGALDLESNGNYTIYDRRDKPVGKKTDSRLGESQHKANFLAAIRSGTPRDLNAEIAEGHKSTLLCHLGNIAHQVNRALHCDAADGTVVDDQEAMGYWSREYEKGWEPSA